MRIRTAVAGFALLASAANCRRDGVAPEGPGTIPLARRPNVLLLTIDTLRADHLGSYGYRRDTSPHIDALARDGTLFEHAFTYWPKTRGSFAMIHTGRFPSLNGFDAASFPLLAPFNLTLASLLQDAGYQTQAVVDNPNVSAVLGFAKGFESYRETWQQKELVSEMDRTRAITAAGAAFLRAASPARPFFLWLHYANPHAPYAPPPPFDTRFLEDPSPTEPKLRLAPSFYGGIPRPLYVSGHRTLSYYVSQYDGEIAAVDEQIGSVLDALHASAAAANTLIILASDHGESLGEHGYYFDHGEDLFDATLAVPLVVVAPVGAGRGRSSDVLAWTLDIMPTILEATAVSRPDGLAGASLLPILSGRKAPRRGRLFAQNDDGLSASWDLAFKLVGTPADRGRRYALYARARDPGETRDAANEEPTALLNWRNELEGFLQARDREWAFTRQATAKLPSEQRLTPEACERLRALGYVQECQS
jgi:arylsulfatase A-like enzyme